jgi:NADPH-dependent curcumin reductase CurA
MTDSKNRQWMLNARPAGKLTGKEFLWNEAPVPRPSDGQALIRTLWLSVDPAQRIWMARDSYKPAVPLGEVRLLYGAGACSSELEERADIAIDGPVPGHRQCDFRAMDFAHTAAHDRGLGR